MLRHCKAFFFYLWILTPAFTVFCNDANANEADTMVKFLTTGFQPEKWEPVSHKTSLGTIGGRVEESVGHKKLIERHYVFRKIPYAEAPVGELRYADPVDAVGSWPGNYLDANRFGNVCAQFDTYSKQVFGDEDCLYLNIFTPTLPGKDSGDKALLPVLVFIHGGGYVRGSSLVLSGGRLAGQNIVLVTFNYRLGALGFFSNGDKIIPGNYGALDQLSALRWVQRNIAEFGGDPARVTVGGFSIGSILSNVHMMSPLAQGLFNNVLMVSGVAHTPPIIKSKPSNSKEFLEKLNCNKKSSEEVKACLISKTPKEIITTQASVMRYDFWPFPFAVTVDEGLRKDPYLPAPIEDLRPRPHPVLMELVPDEGFFFALIIHTLFDHANNVTAAYEEVMPYIISSVWPNPEEKELVGQLVESFYLSRSARTSMDVLVEEVGEIINDYIWFGYTRKTAITAAREGSPVYMSLFTHKDPETPTWGPPLLKLSRSLGLTSRLLDTAVTHGDNLLFPFSKSHFSRDRDEEVAQFLVSNWVNFVYYGTPAVPETEWPPVKDGGSVLMYEISKTPHLQKAPFRVKEANFWEQTIPMVIQNRKTSEEEQGYLKHMPWVVGAILAYITICLMNR